MPPSRHHNSRTHCQAGKSLSPGILTSLVTITVLSPTWQAYGWALLPLRGPRPILRPSQAGPGNDEVWSLVWSCRGRSSSLCGVGGKGVSLAGLDLGEIGAG